MGRTWALGARSPSTSWLWGKSTKAQWCAFPSYIIFRHIPAETLHVHRDSSFCSAVSQMSRQLPVASASWLLIPCTC